MVNTVHTQWKKYIFSSAALFSLLLGLSIPQSSAMEAEEEWEDVLVASYIPLTTAANKILPPGLQNTTDNGICMLKRAQLMEQAKDSQKTKSKDLLDSYWQKNNENSRKNSRTRIFLQNSEGISLGTFWGETDYVEERAHCTRMSLRGLIHDIILDSQSWSSLMRIDFSGTRIQSLEICLPCVEEVILVNCERLAELTIRTKSIRYLNLCESKELRKIEGHPRNFAYIKHLNMISCYAATALNLDLFLSLESFALSYSRLKDGVPNLPTFKGTSVIEKLQKLIVVGDGGGPILPIEKASFIYCTKLKTLIMKDFHCHQETLDALFHNNGRSLQKIILDHVAAVKYGQKRNPKIKKIDMKDLKKLKSLSLIHLGSFTKGVQGETIDMSMFSELKNLESLSFQTPQKMDFLPKLPHPEKLKTLVVSASKESKFFGIPRYLDYLEKLTLNNKKMDLKKIKEDYKKYLDAQSKITQMQ